LGVLTTSIVEEPREAPRRVRGEYTVYSYAHLYNGVNYHLRLAEARGPGSFYSTLSAMLFSALSVEAYLNHIGPLLGLWDKREKKRIYVESKFRLVMSHVGLAVDKGKRLEHSLRQLFRFRNLVAHAETDAQTFESPVSASGHVKMPSASWERMCTVGTAKQYEKYAADIIETLHKAAKLDPPAIGIVGEGTSVG